MRWDEYVTSKREGQNQVDLAVRAGVSQGTISRWEQGSVPSAEKIIAFCRAVGESPVTGLIAANLITEQEANGVTRVAASLSDAEAADLLSELARRLGIRMTASRGVRGA